MGEDERRLRLPRAGQVLQHEELRAIAELHLGGGALQRTRFFDSGEQLAELTGPARLCGGEAAPVYGFGGGAAGAGPVGVEWQRLAPIFENRRDRAEPVAEDREPGQPPGRALHPDEERVEVEIGLEPRRRQKVPCGERERGRVLPAASE